MAVEQVSALHGGAYPDGKAAHLLVKLSMGALILHVKAYLRKSKAIHAEKERVRVAALSLDSPTKRGGDSVQPCRRPGGAAAASRPSVDPRLPGAIVSAKESSAFDANFLSVYFASVEVDSEIKSEITNSDIKSEIKPSPSSTTASAVVSSIRKGRTSRSVSKAPTKLSEDDQPNVAVDVLAARRQILESRRAELEQRIREREAVSRAAGAGARPKVVINRHQWS
jgi:hypothetical protein